MSDTRSRSGKENEYKRFLTRAVRVAKDPACRRVWLDARTQWNTSYFTYPLALTLPPESVFGGDASGPQLIYPPSLARDDCASRTLGDAGSDPSLNARMAYGEIVERLCTALWDVDAHPHRRGPNGAWHPGLRFVSALLNGLKLEEPVTRQVVEGFVPNFRMEVWVFPEAPDPAGHVRRAQDAAEIRALRSELASLGLESAVQRCVEDRVHRARIRAGSRALKTTTTPFACIPLFGEVTSQDFQRAAPTLAETSRDLPVGRAIDRAVERMRREGVPIAEIARRVGVSRDTVITVVKRLDAVLTGEAA